MSLISSHLKQRYQMLSQSASSSMLRHKQLPIAEELVALSQAVDSTDGRDVYGNGGSVERFEQQLCTLFNKPNAVFLPTGTLAQCAAMKCYSEASGLKGIGLHPTSHLLLHEHMAIESLWGLTPIKIGTGTSVLTFDDVRQLDATQLSAIIIELPMREIGGVLPKWDDLLNIRQWCDHHNVKLHMDGARVWQTTPYYQNRLQDIAALFDSVYVSFYKDLGGIFGAALLGESQFINQSRVWARRAGGNPITQYPEVIAARRGVSHYIDQMPSYVEYTLILCDLLQSLPLQILPEKPQASMFHLTFAMSPETLASKVVRYAEQTGIVVLPLPRAGDEKHAICEISIGDRALLHPPEYWAEHLHRCLNLI